MTKRKNPRRIEVISFMCRSCWRRGALNVEWQQLEGKTLEDLRIMCESAHRSTCNNSDVRLINGTKTRIR